MPTQERPHESLVRARGPLAAGAASAPRGRRLRSAVHDAGGTGRADDGAGRRSAVAHLPSVLGAQRGVRTVPRAVRRQRRQAASVDAQAAVEAAAARRRSAGAPVSRRVPSARRLPGGARPLGPPRISGPRAQPAGRLLPGARPAPRGQRRHGGRPEPRLRHFRGVGQRQRQRRRQRRGQRQRRRSRRRRRRRRRRRERGGRRGRNGRRGGRRPRRVPRQQGVHVSVLRPGVHRGREVPRARTPRARRARPLGLHLVRAGVRRARRPGGPRARCARLRPPLLVRHVRQGFRPPLRPSQAFRRAHGRAPLPLPVLPQELQPQHEPLEAPAHPLGPEAARVSAVPPKLHLEGRPLAARSRPFGGEALRVLRVLADLRPPRQAGQARSEAREGGPGTESADARRQGGRSREHGHHPGPVQKSVGRDGDRRRRRRLRRSRHRLRRPGHRVRRTDPAGSTSSARPHLGRGKLLFRTETDVQERTFPRSRVGRSGPVQRRDQTGRRRTDEKHHTVPALSETVLFRARLQQPHATARRNQKFSLQTVQQNVHEEARAGPARHSPHGVQAVRMHAL